MPKDKILEKATMEGSEYTIYQNADDTFSVWDEYGSYVYDFTNRAWRLMWAYYFHASCGLSANEFAVMLCRAGLVFEFLHREYVAGYHHQRFWVTNKSEDEEEQQRWKDQQT